MDTAGAEATSRFDIHTREREITFDEPELLPFGQALAETPRFEVRDAMRWTGTGGTHSWEKIRELLVALVEEGILAIEMKRSDDP